MEKIYKANKDNLTIEEKEELKKIGKVVHSDDQNLVIKTNKELNESKVEELNEMNE